MNLLLFRRLSRLISRLVFRRLFLVGHHLRFHQYVQALDPRGVLARYRLDFLVVSHQDFHQGFPPVHLHLSPLIVQVPSHHRLHLWSLLVFRVNRPLEVLRATQQLFPVRVLLRDLLCILAATRLITQVVNRHLYLLVVLLRALLQEYRVNVRLLSRRCNLLGYRHHHLGYLLEVHLVIQLLLLPLSRVRNQRLCRLDNLLDNQVQTLQVALPGGQVDTQPLIQV